LTVHPKSGPSQKQYVHYHGGAYVYRLLDIHYPTFAELADESGLSVIIPDYPVRPKTTQDMHEWTYAHLESLVAEQGSGRLGLTSQWPRTRWRIMRKRRY